MSACPICGKPVDALRARNVKVRGIQVVAYCSPECLAQAGDSTAVAVPAKPSVAPDSGPVIEIRYEPASGVVTSAKDERTPKPELIKPEAKADDKKADKKADDKKADKKADDKKAEKKADDKKVEKKTEDKPKPVLRIVEEAGAAPRSITPPTGAPIQKIEPEKVSPKKLATDQLEPGKRRLTRETLKRDNSNVDQAEDWLDDEPANAADARPGTELESEKGGTKRALLVLLVIGLLAAGGVILYKFVLNKSTASPKTSTGSLGTTPDSNPGAGSDPGSGSQAQRVVGPAVPEPPEDKRTPLQRSTEVLNHWLAAKDSPRVQRVAAAALSRTQDKVAIERLATALQTDKIEEAGRLDVAYALARAGDKRGVDAIMAMVAAPRRDDKLTVGRMLVQLGDTRAVTALSPYLELTQHKLGAAEWLARLQEPRAIKALEQIRADEKSTADDKARAAIALTHAGKAGFTDELHALLADPRFNWFAAEALASKRDEAARPVLVKLLDVTSLRVGAARSLRLLSPQGKHDAEVKLLLAALDDPNKQRDMEQVSIAEAILLLVGEPAWVERQ